MSYQYEQKEFEVDVAERLKSSAQNPKKRVTAQVEHDRSFGLPVALHGLTVALYLGFIGVMAIGFQEPRMGIVIAICAICIIAAFGVPALWTRMKPEHDGKAQSWGDFQLNGVSTHTGIMKAKDASAQVLILPVLIFGWACAAAAIAAMVG